MNVCRVCGCTELQVRTAARVLGFNDEFERGLYSCCQLVAWADEQWRAWIGAASKGGKLVDGVRKPLELNEAELEPILVRVRKRRQQGNELFQQFR